MDPKYIRVASDLHLEAFLKQGMEHLVKNFLPPDERDAESVLILAGDICSFYEPLIDFLKAIESRFLHVHYVPGNHEYYHSNFDKWNNTVRAAMKEQLKNTSFTMDDVLETRYEKFRIIQATLWADGGKSLFEKGCVGWYLNDFRLIGKTGQYYEMRLFTVDDMIEVHKNQRDGIEDALRNPFDGKTIVVTHHLPSYTLCHPRFGSDCNGGFASDSDDLIVLYHPDIWVHGHTHDTIDTKLAETRIICNPCGYRGEWDSPHNKYQTLFIEV